jgi:adenylate cyclase
MVIAFAKTPNELLYCSNTLAAILQALTNPVCATYPSSNLPLSAEDRSLLDPLVQTRKTLVYADIAESMYLIEENELGAIQDLRTLYRQVIETVIPAHHARLIERVGDGFLIDALNAPSAAALAKDLHRCAEQHSAANQTGRTFSFRIGLHTANVFADDSAIYGSGVNLVARIAANALPGETHLSAQTASELIDGVDAVVQDLGEHYFKHIQTPLRIFKAFPISPQWDISATTRQQKFNSRDATATLQPVLAVLPFSQYTDNRADPLPAAIGLMLADQLIQNMSRSPAVKVISRHSSQQLLQRSINGDLIAQQLGADFLVSGSFIYDGTRLLVNYELRAFPGNRIVIAN